MFLFRATSTAALLLCLTAPAKAWGPLGHRIVNGKAIDALPEPMRKIIRPTPNFSFLEEHASDPDLCRELDPAEALRHFIYLDHYQPGPDPYQGIPVTLGGAEQKFGKVRVRENGTLPWVIDNRFAGLVKAFKEKNRTKIWTEAAWLGHYVADLHVPLHNVSTEGGAAASSAGALARWETVLIDRYVTPDEIEAEPAMVFSRRPMELIREWSVESYRLVEPMLSADRQSMRDGEMDYARFSSLTFPTVRQRLAQAAHRVASLWYTAWEKAGRPTKIPGLPQS